MKQNKKEKAKARSKGGDLPSSTFCVLPWTHLYADEMGTMYPCCFGPNSGTPNVDENGAPIQLHNLDDLERGWNSSFMKQLRREMTSGERPDVCDMCFKYEDLGMASLRQNSNFDLRHLIPEVATDIRPDGSAPLRFRSIDIRLGNRCNLKCRMCSPKSSQGLMTEWRVLLGKHSGSIDRFRNVDWFEQPEFWQGLERHTGEVERLLFAGGEPLLVPQQFEFLKRLAETGKASSIALEYITNGTVSVEGLAPLWRQFKSVRLQVSLDGYGSVNEFIRYPTEWDVLDRNLRYIDEHFAELNLREVNFLTTVQVYNVLRLREMFEYTFSFDNFRPYPNLSILNYPQCFSIQILPPACKGEAVSRLNSFRDSQSDSWPGDSASLQGFQDKIDGVIEHMMAADHQERIPEFLERTRVFDHHRKQQTQEILTDLAPLFEQAESVS